MRKKKQGPCKALGCDSPAHTRGLCQKHYRAVLRAEKASKEQPPEEPQAPPEGEQGPKLSKSEILRQLSGGRPISSPPEAPTKDTKTPPIKPGVKPPLTPAGRPPISGALFLLIGHRLDKATKTKDFGLDKQEAEYMAQLLADAMASRGQAADPMHLFVICMLLWIIPPLIKFGASKFFKGEEGEEEKPTDKSAEKTKEKEGWLSKITGRRKRATRAPVAEAPAPSPMGQAPAQPPNQVNIGGVSMPQYQPGVPANPDLKYHDLKKMEEDSSKHHLAQKPKM